MKTEVGGSNALDIGSVQSVGVKESATPAGYCQCDVLAPGSEARIYIFVGRCGVVRRCEGVERLGSRNGVNCAGCRGRREAPTGEACGSSQSGSLGAGEV